MSASGGTGPYSYAISGSGTGSFGTGLANSIAIAGKRVWVVTETSEWEVPDEYVIRTDNEIRVAVPNIGGVPWNMEARNG